MAKRRPPIIDINQIPPAAATPTRSASDGERSASDGEREARTPPPVNPVEPSRCLGCGSTERTPYHHTVTHDHPGETADGRKYQRVLWRRTECTQCGQTRIDKTLE